VDGECSPSRQPYQFQKATLQMGSAPHCLCPCQLIKMGSAPYVVRPLTEFQHLASFSPYLLPHGSELIENSTFN
jgi:hypothetical protein